VWNTNKLFQPNIHADAKEILHEAGNRASLLRKSSKRFEGKMRVHSIAAMPGDGIGPEVIEAGLEVLAAVAERDGGFQLKVEHFPWGSNYYRQHVRMMPSDGLALLKPFDAIYFGAVGAPDLPDHITLWGLRLAICQGFDQYANVRPARLLAGLASPLQGVGPDRLDWVIIRENSEGEYAGHGGRSHVGHPEEVATETSIFTRAGVERIMRFAFAYAESRPRQKLTVVTKSNAQRHGLVLWDEIAARVAGEFPAVTWDKMLVDAMTTRMVLKPETIDTVVATNLHADILPDLAAALAGSIGIAPTANLDPERRFPSMFEPIHGSAFDITGHGVANPIGAFWTAAMMLDHLGEGAAAARLMDAVERVTAAGAPLTPDLGGSATTRQLTDAVCEAVRASNL
jgi:tartrate dehydrogenase/decarboxylase/D-malate dehydrogenase